jgi:hypothetical protein
MFKSKLTTIVAIASLVILASFAADKYYTLKFSEAALNKHFQNLSAIKQIAERSNLPHQEVVFITGSVDSLQTDILTQVKAQAEPTKK